MHPRPASQARWRRVAARAARQHGVVTARQLLALGLSRAAISGAVAAGRLHRIYAGVYAVGHPALTHEGRWMAAVLACGPGAVLSHRDAAALWDMTDLAIGPVEVTVPGVGSRAQAGIRVHRTRSLAGWEVDAHRAIPVTSPARTLLDLAAVIGRRHLQLAFDEGLRSGMLSPVALEEQVKRARGPAGSARPEAAARDRSGQPR